MRSLLASALVTSLALAVLPVLPQRAEAGTGVLRCQMPDGTVAYTSQACAAMGAKALPLPADVLGRIARDQRRETRLVGLRSGIETDPLAVDALGDGIGKGPAVALARRPLSRGCATTPQQLALDLQAAVAIGDVNRIAESFDWAGMSNQQGQRIMARLAQMAQRPVRDADYFDASTGDGLVFADAGSTSTADGNAGLLQVTFDAGNGDSIVDFNVRRDEGCYFLHY